MGVVREEEGGGGCDELRQDVLCVQRTLRGNCCTESRRPERCCRCENAATSAHRTMLRLLMLARMRISLSASSLHGGGREEGGGGAAGAKLSASGGSSSTCSRGVRQSRDAALRMSGNMQQYGVAAGAGAGGRRRAVPVPPAQPRATAVAQPRAPGGVAADVRAHARVAASCCTSRACATRLSTQPHGPPGRPARALRAVATRRSRGDRRRMFTSFSA